MLTRKTQYAWMALGGLICLFGLVLAAKLRDGNKAIAQVDRPPVLVGPVEDDKGPALPPPAKPTTGPGVILMEPEKVLPPKVDTSKPEAPKAKEKYEPKAVPELPLLEAPPLAKPSSAAKVKAPEAPGPILPASFSPNEPTKEEKKDEKLKSFDMQDRSHDSFSGPSPKGAPAPAKKHAPLPPVPPTTVPPDAGAKPSPGPIGFMPLTEKPADKKPDLIPPPADKPKDVPPPSTFGPLENKVSPTSFAPTSAAPPSGGPLSEHEAKTLPGEPPLAPAPGPVQIYHARAGETLQDIARRTLGSSERWTDIHKLNPTLKADSPLATGTTVRLPGDACVQADDAEPVKPLPSLRPKPTPPKARVLPLTGTYQCSLDEKNQLTLPRSIRDQLGGSETVLISPGPDKCLWLTNQAHLERLAERLDQSQAHEADVRVFKRLYYAQTEKLTVNGDGRVGVPDRLSQFAGLHQEVVLVGIDDHFEVWDAARWRQYTQQKGGAAAPSTAMAEPE